MKTDWCKRPGYNTKSHIKYYLGLFMVIIMMIANINAAANANNPTHPLPVSLTLKDGWAIQSSQKCTAPGETISSPRFDARGWYPAAVPTTVLAALVKNNIYKDIYFAKNLEKIPRQQFEHPWWYRKEFNVDTLPKNAVSRLIFEGINYRANIWLNGKKVAGPDTVTGSFRMFHLDARQHIRKGKNVLAVQVFPPKPGDFTIGFVDWNPEPPDKNMGLWRNVKLHISGPVSLNHPFVKTKVNLQTLDEAWLTVSADLVNHTDRKINGTLTGKILNNDNKNNKEVKQFSRAFTLNPGEKKTVIFSPNRDGLHLRNPRLWWPHTLGVPNLYHLDAAVTIDGGGFSDRKQTTFGIREVSDYINKQGHRGYKINGKEILIRGGGWVDELLLADDDRRIEAQILYTKHMNLNTIRLEGFWGSGKTLYDLADRHGILLMPGWSCHWEWPEYVGKPEDQVDEFGAIKTPEEMDLVSKSLDDQVLWLRNHPSIFVWVLGSDKLPRPRLEKQYYGYLDKSDTTRPRLTACKLLESEISGSSAVKMNGPYDYVPPVYWYVDTKNGGAFGFNTETGPGPQPPPLESLKRMIPGDKLWPVNEMWDYHCGRHEFNTMKRYNDALEKRYGKSTGLDDYLKKAQVANYEAMRAMFEAFGVNKPNTTGIIQWMLNSAWPEMFWQLYDYYLMPNGAFYGAKKASQPLHIAYHYGNRALYIVNDTHKTFTNIDAHVQVFDIHSKKIFSKTINVSASENQSKKIMDFPQIRNLTPVYFLSVTLKNPNKKTIGNNFYWLTTKTDTLDEKNTQWFYTPIKTPADFTSLQSLPPVKLDAAHRIDANKNGKKQITVTLKNPTDKIAFFIELKLTGKQSGSSILPIFWDDNFFSLLPGETRTVTGTYFNRDANGEQPAFSLSGWNVK